MRFLVLVVLSLAIFSLSTAQGTPGNWTPVQWNPNNDNLVGILDYAVGQVTFAAMGVGQLSPDYWQWTNVISVQTQVASGTNYEFIVDIASSSGGTAKLTVIVLTSEDETSESLVNYTLSKM